MTMPTPYYDRDGITIYHGDCLAILPELAEAHIDAVVTDPPYGIGYARGNSGAGAPGRRDRRSEMASFRRDESPIVGDDLPFKPAPWLIFPRVLLWGADRWPALPPGGTVLAWDKSVGRGPADNFVDCEFAWCNWREPRNVFRMLWKGLACEKQGEDNGLRQHPTQKPLRLMRWCIEITPGDPRTILDPYMGSGTTLVAAQQLGRRAIGIEIEERYCEAAVKRLAQGMLPWAVSI